VFICHHLRASPEPVPILAECDEMVAPVVASRIISIGTKVTQAEHSRLMAVVGTRQRVSEWVRETLLRAVDFEPEIATLFAEVLALRTIILNIHTFLCWQASKLAMTPCTDSSSASTTIN
jgi:hypothetical protein